jgi:hypothetical protein
VERSHGRVIGESIVSLVPERLREAHATLRAGFHPALRAKTKLAPVRGTNKPSNAFAMMWASTRHMSSERGK